MKRLSDTPCAGTPQAGARNRPHEGRFTGALLSHDGDGRSQATPALAQHEYMIIRSLSRDTPYSTHAS